MAFKRTPHNGDTHAVLVIEPTKFERRCLVRLMRAAGAERVAEAADIEAARRVLSLRRPAQWLLIADPDHLPGEAMSLLRSLAQEHAVTMPSSPSQVRPRLSADVVRRDQALALVCDEELTRLVDATVAAQTEREPERRVDEDHSSCSIGP